MTVDRAQTPLTVALLAVVALACPARDAGDDTTATAAGDAAPCVEGGGTPTITAAGVGPLRIGTAVSSIASRCTVRDTSFTLGEGITENGRVVDLGGSSAVLLVSADAEPTISRIIVADRAIRTEEGIGVGTSVGSMRAAYGQICPMVGEGRVVLATPPLPGVSFGISQRLSSLPGSGANIERTPDAIPDSSTITSIWVHGASTRCGGS
jgi:hypothetical protein